MHASKDNWVRYPQEKPKEYGWYKTITANGKVEPQYYSNVKLWDPNFVLAFINAPVPDPSTYVAPKARYPSGRRSLYKEYMDAGKYSAPNDYTQFTDVESPAQIPIKNQLNQLLGLLPDDTALEQLGTTLSTFKTMAQGMDFESPSNEMEIKQLISDIDELRKMTKSVRYRVDGLNRDLNIDTQEKNEPPYEDGTNRLK